MGQASELSLTLRASALQFQCLLGLQQWGRTGHCGLQVPLGSFQRKAGCSVQDSSSLSMLMRVAVQHLQAAASTRGRDSWPSQLHLGDVLTCGKLRQKCCYLTARGPLPQSGGLRRERSQE